MGVLFYAEASKALTGKDRLTLAAEQMRTAHAGRLIIASDPSAATSLLPVLVSVLLADRPGVLVRLRSRNSDGISRLLPTESCDVGIAELPIDETAVRLTRFRTRCVAILPAGHPLSPHRALSPTLLAGHPAVSPARTLQTSVRVLKTFAGAGAGWTPVVEAEYFASVCARVASGAGWSIVDPLSAQTFRHLGLAVRDFEPAIRYEIGSFYSRDCEPSILAQAFMSMLAHKLNARDV